ncbi:hypothetical protein SALBM311S_10085 [Streptomyces alboniger]
MQPRTGLRPAARKTSAPSGMRVTYAASPATWATIAVIDSAKVRHFPGTRATMRRSRVVNSPLAWATEIPNPTMRMVASGGKVAKLSTTLVVVSPALLSRLWTSMVSCVPGCRVLTPAAARIALRTITTPARIQNSQNGLGSLLRPSRSPRRHGTRRAGLSKVVRSAGARWRWHSWVPLRAFGEGSR